MVHGVCDNFSAKGNGVTGSPEPWTMGVFAEPNSVRSSHTNLLYFWYNTDQGDLSEPSIFDVNGIDKPARLLLASLKKHRQDFGILSDNDDKVWYSSMSLSRRRHTQSPQLLYTNA